MAAGCMIMTQVWAQAPQEDMNPLLLQADQNTPASGVSPARRINRQAPADAEFVPANSPYRSIDGSGNHPVDVTLGSAGTALFRMFPADYGDEVETPAGGGRPGPRLISNSVSAQSVSIPNTLSASDYVWQWGQFLDHDIDLTDGTDPPEPDDITVPAGDPYFDPGASGTVVISFNRSLYDPATGTDSANPRQQLNEITSWIDASNVYGSDIERALALRSNDGSGRLRTGDNNLLPFNDEGLANAGGDSAELFLAGDVRANEQVGLTAMHTLFMREHNRLASAATRPPVSRQPAIQYSPAW
jgi:hypothetical protein